MIKYKTGNMLQDNAEALVNTVDCTGALERGIALEFKKICKGNFKKYAEACKRGDVRLGKMLVFKTGTRSNPRYIINFPINRHWRDKSRIEDIKEGLASLSAEIKRLNIRSIAIPALGCGLEGLRWEEVNPLIEQAVQDFRNVRISIFMPRDELANPRIYNIIRDEPVNPKIDHIPSRNESVNLRIYHIVHVENLPSIIEDEYLWCNKKMKLMQRKDDPETAIGDQSIKQKRTVLSLKCYPDLCVGDCVPFYFCPRSVMLHKIHMDHMTNYSELSSGGRRYKGGQEPIVHLESDFYKSVAWAKDTRRWAFTLSSAASCHAEHSNELDKLDEIDWQAVRARYWQEVKKAKQAEFLMEGSFSWNLISRIGVSSEKVFNLVVQMLKDVAHKPAVSVEPDWYYQERI